MAPTIAVLSIATNNYKGYWQQMAQTLFENVNSEIVLHVASEDSHIADEIIKNINQKQAIKVHSIPAYGWPEATLLRFEIYKNIIPKITQEYICYLDADMLVHSDFMKDLEPQFKLCDVILVQHPGFYRPKKIKLFEFYMSNPIFAIKDLKSKVLVGSLGSWETNPISEAFVSRPDRKKYVCGGFWIGRNKPIKKLISDLNLQVLKDNSNKLVAKWHDESHLNKWAIKNDYCLVEPSFCFDETYPNLKGIKKIISAVRK